MTPLPGNVQGHEIGSKQFGMQDQQIFASLSCDRNPMHVDPVAARRLLTGQPVVHGIHVLMTALEYWENGSAQPPAFLDCTFNNPVSVGDIVVFRQIRYENGDTVIEAGVNGLLCARLRLTAARAPSPQTATVAGAEVEGTGGRPVLERVGTPLDESPDHHLNRKYSIRLDPVDVSRSFPRTCDRLGASRAAGLLALSYFVGMVCPGLHSIFSRVTLKLDAPAAATPVVDFSVDRYDERFRLFNVSLSGMLSGGLAAFLRPVPQQQLTMADVSMRVTRDEFKGTRSLVVGASRGLGELAAKILAAGGGDVTITYAQGLEDIEVVNAEINASGLGSSRIQKLDATAWDFDAIDFAALNAIYLFATPRINRKKAAVFVPSLLHEFIDFYVKSLYDLCRHIESLALPGKIRVYVPSSVFVTERPEGLTEYAMAKAAAEILADDLNRAFSKVSIVVTRLPRLSTDQTTSVLKMSSGDNLDALLPAIRTMTRR